MPRKGQKLSPEAAARQAQAQAAWHREHYERIGVAVKIGRRDAYRRLAEARGKSVNAMIQEYMDSEYEKEFGEPIK